MKLRRYYVAVRHALGFGAVPIIVTDRARAAADACNVHQVVAESAERARGLAVELHATACTRFKSRSGGRPRGGGRTTG